MGRFLVVASAVVALTACKKDKPEGLAPAQNWSANAATMPAAPQQPANPHAGANPHAADPHAGMNMPSGGDPHAGLNMPSGGDPHAGVNMQNPHGGPDVSKMGLPPPDPNRKIDPTRRVAGTIKIHPKAKDKVVAGGAVFVVIKKAGPDGAPVGPPLAVDKLTWAKDELAFEMTEAQSMIAGTELTGDVVVTVRYDGDGDALSKNPGDVVGTLRVKVPADKVTVVLDEVL